MIKIITEDPGTGCEATAEYLSILEAELKLT
jgi:hypothetical protein